MARTQYSEVVTFVDTTTGALMPADNARVSVFLPGTSTLVTIYTTRSAGTTKANPFTTGSDGSVEFWAEWGDYDIKYEDLNLPIRFGTKTFGWSSSSGANASVPIAALDAIVTRQLVPIGAVLSWFRPDNTVSVPTGWAICDGTSVSSVNHDFGTGAAFNLPDLRNKFILGANIALADAAAATAGDASTNAPGIRGAGSSHARNIQHSHTVNSHTHTVSGATGSVGNHQHVQSASAGPSATFVMQNESGGGPFVTVPTGDHFHGFASQTSADGSHSHSLGFESASTSPGTNTQLGTTQDIKPLYVGLLQIMKVKRN